jgi:Fic family protein
MDYDLRKSSEIRCEMKYIYERKKWPEFTWDRLRIMSELAQVRHNQGRLLGRMEGLGFQLRTEASLTTLTEDVVKSSQIEGESLERLQVRSSISRRLGLDVTGLPVPERDVEGIVEVMLDATQNAEAALTSDRLFGWHAALFPAGRSGTARIRTGIWRDDKNGPMQVISGAVGRQRVHFQAPAADRLKTEMKSFLTWFNDKAQVDPVLKAAQAHLWFITLHPFDDGNGRLARAITDMALARSENSSQRFYSMSGQICRDRKAYYEILEKTQKADLDVTEWLGWFLGCLDRAIKNSEAIFDAVREKNLFWDSYAGVEFNNRQRAMLNRLLDGFEGKLTSTKWALLSKCSQDTASRDIEELIQQNVLIKNPGSGRSTSFSLKKPSDSKQQK